MTAETATTAAGVLITVALAAAAAIWRASRIAERIVSSTDRNSAATHRLASSVDGLNATVAVQHERLNYHEKRLDDHHGRLLSLEGE